MRADVAFAVASALHAGFQLTVTVLVYPALASRSSAEWVEAHARHSRAITPLVGLVYAALVGTGAWLVTTGPSPAAYVGLAGAAAALLVTATLAAPISKAPTQVQPGTTEVEVDLTVTFAIGG